MELMAEAAERLSVAGGEESRAALPERAPSESRGDGFGADGEGAGRILRRYVGAQTSMRPRI